MIHQISSPPPQILVFEEKATKVHLRLCQSRSLHQKHADLSAVPVPAPLRALAFNSRSFVICLIWLKLVGRCSSADRGTGPISLLFLLVAPVVLDTVSAENDFFNRRWRASSIMLALVFQSSELLESPESSKMQSSTKSKQFEEEMYKHQNLYKNYLKDSPSLFCPQKSPVI